MESRILGSFEPGSEKSPAIHLCKSSKKAFARTKIKFLHFTSIVSLWSSSVWTAHDFSWWSEWMSKLFNIRIERPNNQEPVLGTDERAIIFKTPLKLFGWKSEYQLQQLPDPPNLNFRVVFCQGWKATLYLALNSMKINWIIENINPCKKDRNWPQFTPAFPLAPTFQYSPLAVRRCLACHTN